MVEAALAAHPSPVTRRTVMPRFCVDRTGNPGFMEPNTSTDPLPIAQVSVGMTVLDAIGLEAGVVNAVQLPGTDVRPDAPVGIAEHLMGAGYLRIDGTGYASNDVYAAGDQIAGINDGDPVVVELRVQREELPRAED